MKKKKIPRKKVLLVIPEMLLTLGDSNSQSALEILEI